MKNKKSVVKQQIRTDKRLMNFQDNKLNNIKSLRIKGGKGPLVDPVE